MLGAGALDASGNKDLSPQLGVFFVILWACEEVTLGREVGTGSAHRKVYLEEIGFPQTPTTFASWNFFGMF